MFSVVMYLEEVLTDTAKLFDPSHAMQGANNIYTNIRERFFAFRCHAQSNPPQFL